MARRRSLPWVRTGLRWDTWPPRPRLSPVVLSRAGRAQAGGATHAASVVAAAAVADASAPAVVSAWLAAPAGLLGSSAGLPVFMRPLLLVRHRPFMISRARSEAHSIGPFNREL